MATGQDTSYSGQIKIYLKQSPEQTTLNGNTVVTEEVTDVGGLQSQSGLSALNGQILPGLISFTFTPNGSTISKCSIQVQDNGGKNLTQTDGKTPPVFHLDVSLALSTGVITSLTPSTGLTVVTGTLLNS